jgi:hypothetical protein
MRISNVWDKAHLKAPNQSRVDQGRTGQDCIRFLESSRREDVGGSDAHEDDVRGLLPPTKTRLGFHGCIEFLLFVSSIQTGNSGNACSNKPRHPGRMGMSRMVLRKAPRSLGMLRSKFHSTYPNGGIIHSARSSPSLSSTRKCCQRCCKHFPAISD